MTHDHIPTLLVTYEAEVLREFPIGKEIYNASRIPRLFFYIKKTKSLKYSKTIPSYIFLVFRAKQRIEY